jgi:hypothetical protein
MALPAVEKLPLPSKKLSADWSVGIKLSFVTDPHVAFGAWQGCNDVGKAQLVSTEALANLFKRFAERGLECVVLNASYSEI